MRGFLLDVSLAAALAAGIGAAPAPVAAQGSAKTSLSGTVVDAAGGAVPGATVVVKHTATGSGFDTVTNSSGAFSLPALDPGTYSVTVSLQGFKTTVVASVVLVTGSPGSITVALEVGSLSETVEVRGGTELIQTQSAAVASTINANQIQNLPLTSRNALSFVTMLPGIDTADGVARNSTLFGLPEQAINITIDGINTNNNFQRETDGFYSMVFPQLDAVEQVTVTGATAGAESAGGGSVSIRFVTRSGTNEYKGAGYYYFRHPSLNTNYYFLETAGLPKNKLILNQFGGSFGGPIKIPGWFNGRDRAFFFVNYEEFYQPTSADRTRAILNPLAQQGIFRYDISSGGTQSRREVNLFTLAALNGQTSTMDPTVSALLAQIRSLADASVSSGAGSISENNNANQQQFLYLAPGKYYNHLPTTRLDFNLTNNHRLSGSYWWQEINRYPDIQNNGETTFPGLPNAGNYVSIRSVGSITLRSNLRNNLVNELIGGWQYSPSTFNSGVEASQFDNQGMFNLGFPTLGGTALTAATRSTNPNRRDGDNVNITNTLSWLTGSHSVSVGGGFTRVRQWNDATQVVPNITFGVQAGLDPAEAMFNTANFPGASAANLTDARALYAFLTGRVTAVNANARLDEDTLRYRYLGLENIRARMDEYSLFAQDSWRITPKLTLNYGLAWQLQMPIRAGNSTYSTTDYASFCGPYGIGADGRCRVFQTGGAQNGVWPSFVQYSDATRGYETDRNNAAPNIGAAWRPGVENGWLRRLLGDPEQATLRGGYSVAYNRPGLDEFTGVYNNNPGRVYNANRTNNTGAAHLLVNAGESWPVLFRDRSRLGPPAGIPDSPVYPILATSGSSLAIFDADLQIPYTRSFSAGFQRSLSRNMAFEVRYVGTRGRAVWTEENWNEVNVIENGFLDEFRLAQANLKSAVDAGLCGTPATCTFAYRGPGTGTSPLPTFLGYLTGQPASAAGAPAAYTTQAAAAAFTNPTLLGRLSLTNPAVLGTNSITADLQTAARIANALAASIPSNYFRMNPAVGTNNVELTTSDGGTRYDSVVFEVRRRLADGFAFNANYTRSWRSQLVLDTLRRDRSWVRSTGNTGEVPHAIKMTANWDLPFGQGHRYLSNANRWLNGVVGNWSVNMTGRVQSGRLLTATGIRLVGMTPSELADIYKIRESNNIVYILPDDVILNTRRAFDTNPTSPTGYGTLGPPEGRYIAPASDPSCIALYAGDCTGVRNPVFLHGPVFTRWDVNAKKRFPLGGRAFFTFELHVLNVTDAVNFTPVFNPGSGGSIFQVTNAFQDISGNYDPGGRLMQLVWRVSW
jgi:hypothetical protein